MSEYTHLVRSYDGAGKRSTTWHTSYAKAVGEQLARSEIHFDVVVMPVIPERVSLPAHAETVTVYHEAKRPARLQAVAHA